MNTSNLISEENINKLLFEAYKSFQDYSRSILKNKICYFGMNSTVWQLVLFHEISIETKSNRVVLGKIKSPKTKGENALFDKIEELSHQNTYLQLSECFDSEGNFWLPEEPSYYFRLTSDGVTGFCSQRLLDENPYSLIMKDLQEYFYKSSTKEDYIEILNFTGRIF